MTDYKPGKIITIIGDGHIYSDHINQINTQLERDPYHFPTLNIKKKLESITVDYNSDPINYRDLLSNPIQQFKILVHNKLKKKEL